MEGNVLYPLNVLKDKNPKLFESHAAKYKGREHVMNWKISRLDCLWNDVIHLTAVHPKILKEALMATGMKRDLEMACYQIDPRQLDPEKMIVFLYDSRPESGSPLPTDYVEFNLADMEKYSIIPEFTKAYYKKVQDEGRNPLAFFGVPHILYKGSIDVTNLPIVRT
jgi:hypothetical protein